MAGEGNPNMRVGAPSVNPKGRTPSIWADSNRVAENLLNKYSGEEIRALAADPKRCAKELSSFQEMILIQLANALNARGDADMALERERLLDRHGGKSVSRTELTGKGGTPLQINVVTGVEHDVIEGVIANVTELDENS